MHLRDILQAREFEFERHALVVVSAEDFHEHTLLILVESKKRPPFLFVEVTIFRHACIKAAILIVVGLILVNGVKLRSSVEHELAVIF